MMVPYTVVRFLTSGSIVAIAADRKSVETICCIRVIQAECISENTELDDYEHQLQQGMLT